MNSWRCPRRNSHASGRKPVCDVILPERTQVFWQRGPLACEFFFRLHHCFSTQTYNVSISDPAVVSVKSPTLTIPGQAEAKLPVKINQVKDFSRLVTCDIETVLSSNFIENASLGGRTPAAADFSCTNKESGGVPSLFFSPSFDGFSSEAG